MQCNCVTRLVGSARLRIIQLPVPPVLRLWLELIMQQQQWPAPAVLSPTIMPNSFKQSTAPQTWPLQNSKISHTIQTPYSTRAVFHRFTPGKSSISKPSLPTRWCSNSIRFRPTKDCWSVPASEANAAQTIQFQWHYLEPLKLLFLLWLSPRASKPSSKALSIIRLPRSP